VSDGEREHADGGRRRWALALVLVTLVVGATRFLALGRWGLWYDEALTWAAHAGAVEYEFWTYPLWYLSSGAVQALSGGDPSELQLRLLPAVSGFLAVVGTWWAFRRTAGDHAAGAAALVLAVSSWHQYLSQTARPYSTALALSLLGAGVALRGAERRSTAALLGGVGIALVAAGFHPSAAIGALGVALAALAWRAPRAVPWLALGVPVLLVAGAAVLPTLAEAVGLPLKHRPSTRHVVLAFGFHVGPLTLVGAAVGGLLALRRGDRFARVAVLYCATVLAAGLALSLFTRVSARYLLWAVPWLALCASLPLAPRTASGEGSARAPRVRLAWAWLALLVLPQFAGLGLYFSAWNGSRPYWREAYRFAARSAGPDDALLGVGALVGDYYLRRDGDPRTVHTLSAWPEVVEALPAGGHAWIVLRPEELEDWGEPYERNVEAFLRERCRLQRSFVNVPTMGRDLSLQVFRSDPAGAAGGD